MKTLGCIRFAAAALCAVLLAILTVACHDKRQLLSSRVRSVYYWSTTLNIDSTKTAFLRAHGISRMYVRYFDVVADAGGRGCLTPRLISLPQCHLRSTLCLRSSLCPNVFAATASSWLRSSSSASSR